MPPEGNIIEEPDEGNNGGPDQDQSEDPTGQQSSSMGSSEPYQGEHEQEPLPLDALEDPQFGAYRDDEGRLEPVTFVHRPRDESEPLWHFIAATDSGALGNLPTSQVEFVL